MFKCAAVFLPWRRPELLEDMSALAVQLRLEGVDRVLIVSDEKLISLGLHNKLIEMLDFAGIHFYIYDKRTRTPLFKTLKKRYVYIIKKTAAGLSLSAAVRPLIAPKASERVWRVRRKTFPK